MPEIEFTIDPATGELQLHVRGIAGPACGDVARLAEALLGRPAVARNTPEHALRPRIEPRIRTGPGR